MATCQARFTVRLKNVRIAPARAQRPGPGSVAWRVNAERAAVLGWGRAILLQLAHPLVAEGVAAHSTFRGAPHSSVVRFHATVRAMLGLTFGTEDDARRTIAHIRSIHDGVHGHLPDDAGRLPAGAPYSAHDPALLAWVHLTLVESVPGAYARFVQPLSELEMSQYADESRWAAELIGARLADLPATARDVEQRMRAVLESGALSVTDTARELARTVVYPPLGWATGPFARVHALAAIGDLPPALRDAYGFRWDATDARALEAWTRRLRWWHRVAPRWVRQWRLARVAETRIRASQRER
jgi:uncharacterized protein (DUF2236 family)